MHHPVAGNTSPDDWGPNDDHAIVVGISRYPSLSSLGGPEFDAQAFYDWVTSPHGGNVPHAALILSSQFPVPPKTNDWRPTEEAIDNAFAERWIVGKDSGHVGRRLYLYFAGHGLSPVEDGMPVTHDAGLLMANARAGLMYHVAGKTYAEAFRTAGYFDEVILFMDCCRDHTARLRLRRPPWEPEIAQVPGRAFYALSADWNGASHEAAWVNGGPVRGLFTLALMTALHGGARRARDGSITAEALKDAVINHMRDIAAAYIAVATGQPKGGVSTYSQDPVWEIGDPTLSFPCSAPVNVPGAGARVIVRLTGPNVGIQPTLKDGNLKPLLGAMISQDTWEWRVQPPNMCAVSLGNGTKEFIQVAAPNEVYRVSL